MSRNALTEPQVKFLINIWGPTVFTGKTIGDALVKKGLAERLSFNPFKDKVVEFALTELGKSTQYQLVSEA